jgi:hypothetical protein
MGFILYLFFSFDKFIQNLVPYALENLGNHKRFPFHNTPFLTAIPLCDNAIVENYFAGRVPCAVSK